MDVQTKTFDYGYPQLEAAPRQGSRAGVACRMELVVRNLLAVVCEGVLGHGKGPGFPS